MVPPPDQHEDPQAEFDADLDDSAIGVAARRSAVALVALAGIAAGGIWWANRKAPEPPPVEVDAAPPKRGERDVELPSFSFVDVAAAAGLSFSRTSGAAGERFLPETMGSGVALFDYDSDGDADLCLIDSRAWSEPREGDPSSLVLYRNDSSEGELRFSDVTTQAGFGPSFYGMGCAVGDVDGDGDLDLY